MVHKEGCGVVMGIALFVLAALLLFVSIKYVLYRRQIRKLCRQLSFLQSTVTNQLIRIEMREPEIRELALRMNEIYDAHRKTELALRREERHMKEMITSVSHDIRTPLTALIGYFQLLELPEEPEQKEYVAIMKERMTVLSELLDELFTYTKLQNEDYELEISTQDFTRLVLDTLFSFYEAFKEQGVEPQMDICEERVQVTCNDVAVKRILSNIIRNALLHGSGDICLCYRIENGCVYFSCENTLENPDELEVERLFDRFYKADRSRGSAKGSASTGLGLSIARELAEHMNGKVEACVSGKQFRICFSMPMVSE